MINKILPEYLLGEAFDPKYKETFIEQIPFFIHSLDEISFDLDKNGNYKFSKVDEISRPFIEMSAQNISIGNFFIVFQRYLKQSLNLIWNGAISDTIDNLSDFNAYIKFEKELFDHENQKIQHCFASINKKYDEIILVYFYKDPKYISYTRNKISNLYIGEKTLKNHDIITLKIISYFLKNNLQENKDIIKNKYKHRFSEKPYYLL